MDTFYEIWINHTSSLRGHGITMLSLETNDIQIAMLVALALEKALPTEIARDDVHEQFTVEISPESAKDHVEKVLDKIFQEHREILKQWMIETFRDQERDPYE